MGETSKLVALYTEECGKLKVTAKGARKPQSKYGAALELLSEIQAVCYVRDERELQILSEAHLLRSFSGLVRHLERLAFGSAACELIDRLTIEHEPNRRLYGYLAGVLGALEEVEPEQLEALFWYYQLRVAEALGYRPELGRCVSCRAALQGTPLWFSPALGGGLCDRCDRVGASRVSGASLGLLAALQNLPTYSREAIPAVPPQRAEIREMLRTFMAYHAGGRLGLKSLEFLTAVAEKTRAADSTGDRHG